MSLSFGGPHPEQVGGDASGPDDGERRQRHEQGELAGVGETGVLDVQAAGLRGAEQAFDRPAFAIGGEGLAAGKRDVEALCGEA
ncbi:MAG: hypothetical protein CVT86_05630 [Alphaproteobacteria bacterium HGW-Alphaproteobacteria-8]|nr:MAG: hypothetical protein CVT86_05630 [Alphaproteobacteria bacterium HGW-Alphaproteobacteria-8]